MVLEGKTIDIKGMASLMKKVIVFIGTFPVPPKNPHSFKIMKITVVFIFLSMTAVTYGQLDACVNFLCRSGYVCNTGFLCYPETTCFDVATNCATNVGLCTNSLYLSTMTSKCRKTCNLCGGTNTTCCSDSLNSSGINECPTRAHLCNNTAYYTLMTQQCPRTCGRCVCG